MKINLQWFKPKKVAPTTRPPEFYYAPYGYMWLGITNRYRVPVSEKNLNPETRNATVRAHQNACIKIANKMADPESDYTYEQLVQHLEWSGTVHHSIKAAHEAACRLHEGPVTKESHYELFALYFTPDV